MESWQSWIRVSLFWGICRGLSSGWDTLINLAPIVMRLVEARQLSKHTLCFALHYTWVVGWSMRSDPVGLLQCAEELLALSTEHGFSFLRGQALVDRAWCRAALGHSDQGDAAVGGVQELRAVWSTFAPAVLTRIADVYRMAGQPEVALTHLAEAQGSAAASGVKWVLAETLWLRGEALVQLGDKPGAEASLSDAIALARRQDAKLFELRAGTGLARLWRDQGRSADAQNLLGPIYNWFTEGFDTPVLNAKTLLDELSDQSGIATSASL